MKRVFFLSAALSALTLAACGSESTETGQGGGTIAEAAATAVPAVFNSTASPATPTVEEGGDLVAAWLAAYGALEGAETSPSGLVLVTLEEGTGLEPQERDLVKINFAARVAGSDENFESTWTSGSPVIITPAQTLPGWAEALTKMKQGGKTRAILPPALGFGVQGMPGGPVGPNEVTVFDLELLGVYPADDDAALEALTAEVEGEIQKYQTESQRQQTLAQQQFVALASINGTRSDNWIQSQAAREETTQTASGLVYEVVTAGGSEDASPLPEDTVRVNYRGTLPDGTEFDSSYSRGEPTEFQLNQVIGGWTEGLQLMKPGDTFRFYIPARLAYGQQGVGNGLIGPNQALAFDVELISVNPEAAEETNDINNGE